MVAALTAIEDGQALKRASIEYGIPAHTLRRHRDKKVLDPGDIRLGRHRPALSPIIEKAIHDHIVFMEKRLFGLSTRDVRRLAFDVAQKAGVAHPFNFDKGLAGKDWMYGFFARHRDLSIRKAQATNIARAVGFNRPKVLEFFQVYSVVFSIFSFPPSNIWNMDETGVTNVHRPHNIIATKGVRQVAKMTSGERGQMVTLICAMNAIGNYLPPMFIFPRVRMVEGLLTGSPPQSVGHANPSRWTDHELFVKWLQHFVDATTALKLPAPHLIILDGHNSHKSLAAVEFARTNGLHLLTLPPHCTHRMQPLDRTFLSRSKALTTLLAMPGCLQIRASGSPCLI